MLRTMLQLVRVKYHETDVSKTRERLEALNQWINERKETGSENVLATILAAARDDNAPVLKRTADDYRLGLETRPPRPTAITQDQALAFAAVLAKLTAKEPDNPLANAAAELGRTIRNLAEAEKVLHLALM